MKAAGETPLAVPPGKPSPYAVTPEARPPDTPVVTPIAGAPVPSQAPHTGHVRAAPGPLPPHGAVSSTASRRASAGMPVPGPAFPVPAVLGNAARADGGIRQTIVESAQDLLEPEGVAALPFEPARARRREDATELCSPTTRLPVPVLWIVDDGQASSQPVWLRQSPASIGRNRGTIQIPHDAGISDPHALILWTKSQLLLRNMKGSNGTFVRARKAMLEHGQELRIGHGRYRFEEPGVVVQIEPPPQGVQGRLVLEDVGYWLGRDTAAGLLAIADDSTVERRHTRIPKDRFGQWHLADNQSRNGTWVAIEEVVVEKVVEFLVGEQIFRLESASKGAE